jgi:NAD(P)-dependent dehydrogenase (short-subunit alcohol dehydrogenase family)
MMVAALLAFARASSALARGASAGPSFAGKTALVTGAASGIGLRCAQRLAERGARVVGVVSRESRVQAFREHLEGDHRCVVADLSSVEDVRRCAEEAGDVDLLVNAAGVGAMASFLDVEPELFDKCMAVNCRAPLVLSQCIARNMIRRGEQGAIVHVSSQSSSQAIRDRCAYSLTKAGVDYLTKSMALELGEYGIRTNCVNPTVVLTPLGEAAWADPAKREPMLRSIPLGRFAEVDDVADTVLYLLSDSAAMVNGVCVPVDGGFLAARAHLP